jgi:hypothetical protein
MVAQGVPAYCFDADQGGRALTCAILKAGTREGLTTLRTQADARSRVAQARSEIERTFLTTPVAGQLGSRVDAVRREGRWLGVDECGGYMGAAVYEIPCTAEAYLSKIWIFDVYKSAQIWLGHGVMSNPSSSSDRTRWLAQISKFIAASQSATGTKPVWMQPRTSVLGFNPGNRTLVRERVDPIGRRVQSGSQGPAPGSVHAQNLSLFGPERATAMVRRWWDSSRRQGRRLFVPISHSSFFAGGTRFPGQPTGGLIPATSYLSGHETAGSKIIHDAIERDILFLEAGNVAGTGEPWDLMEDGRYIQAGTHIQSSRRWTVTEAESKRWSFDGIGTLGVLDVRRTSDPSYSYARGGFLGLTPVVNGRGQKLTRADVFDGIARRNDPGELVPLELLFPDFPNADYFMVPTWSALHKYVSEWAKPLLQEEGAFILSGWVRYLRYFEQWPPEALGMSAREHAELSRALHAAAQAADLATISVVGGVASGVASLINPYVAIVVLVVQLVATLIALFKERRIPCPPIPMPFMTKTGPIGSECDFTGIVQSPEMMLIQTVNQALKVGLRLPLPSNIDPALLGPDPDLGALKTSNIPLIVGGLIAAAAAMALVVRGG